MARGELRMVEVVRRVSRHPQLLVQAQRFESERERGPRALGRVALAPVLERQAVADFDARRKVRVERGNREADEADERRVPGDIADFGGPRAEAVLREMISDVAH